MSKMWFVTGTSRGLGKAIADAALEAGDAVVAAARGEPAKDERDQQNERLLAVKLGIIDSGEAIAAVKAAIERFGRIDVLVNNAGFGFQGMFEELFAEEIRQSFETNVFGTMNLLRAALPVLRSSGPAI